MPGIPTGRGCGACRKVKKKCDQMNPSCSRCRRLRLDCVGNGQRRFKFVEQMIDTRSQLALQARSFSRTPSNEMTARANALISALEVTDLRYSLACYGGFLNDVPRRLGTNDALDASVVALTSSLSSHRTGQKSTNALAKYGHALKTLRICMGDPVKAQSPDTLCAIFLVMQCHGWIGKYEDHVVSHGEAMSIVLDAATSRVWSGDFERQILVISAVPVIFESFANPKIQWHPWFDRLLTTYGLREDTSRFPSLSLRGLAKIPSFVRDPEMHLLEMRCTYQQIGVDYQSLHRQLTESIGSTLHAQCQAMLGVMLALALVVNHLLQLFDKQDASLIEELERFCSETLVVGEQAMQYRPLGASLMPLCLITAWAVTNDTLRRVEIAAMISEYQMDFEVVRWMEGAVWLEKTLKSLRQRLFRSQLEKT